MELHFFDEPQEFLDVTGDHLARQPVVSTVVATVAERIVREQTAGIPWPAGVPCWFVAVLQDGDVVGAAMRTATFGGARVPVHRPSEPDIKQDLPTARLPRRRRHGADGRATDQSSWGAVESDEFSSVAATASV